MARPPGLPLVAPLPSLTPAVALAALEGLPHAFLLHSALEGARGRWSFFGADPFARFRGRRYDDAVRLWRRLAARALEGPAPFTGGVVGAWSYDFARRLERLPAVARDDLGLPDVTIAFHDVVGAIDHATGAAWLVSSGLPLEGAGRIGRARRRLASFARRLEAAAGRGGGSDPAAARAQGVPRSTFGRDAYRAAVERVRDHIRRGDIFQANLSQRWSVPLEPAGLPPGPTARALFGSLARRSPAPFAAFLDAGDHAMASASPERFLELRGARVETRPIKGTRPRGADPAEDAALARELSASAKDRAENVMIVDVLRNDLGRVCATGSVRATALCELERFPQVFHLTSTVTGELAPGIDAFDLLHACFPGGSITGAPKIRAMEIIERLEPVRRHVYTGAIGYVDWRGDADWNIAIRGALVTPDAIHCAAGGGITADSDPDAEYEETLHKATGLAGALADLGAQVAGLLPEPTAAAAPVSPGPEPR
ncbi:MAG TPA: aminodeoxychorismate synthase component I [Candidatus Eisenbacteria bacterium]